MGSIQSGVEVRRRRGLRMRPKLYAQQIRKEIQRGFDRIEGVTRIEAEAGRQIMAQVCLVYPLTIFSA